ncbi:PIN domain-containing protein [Pedobacter immunditicola]|uniref:PIN domain-containing protein n=1 Tax=Pedobacter immunditicola TaxID=3133440 RepID=UPI00309CD61A
MIIILDTSIWIEYFRGTAEYFDTCQQLLEKGEVSTIEIIFAELLQGTLNNSEADIVKAYYELIVKVEIDNLYILAGEFSRQEKLVNKGIGLIDACIITATLKSNAKLWTLDKKIKNYLSDEFLFVT